MAEKQIAGDGVPPSLAGMSKSQLYDIMCQMKALIEQNQQQARQILIQNPVLTRALFQAQILLGMVQPPLTSAISSSVSQNSQPAVPTQQSIIPTASPFSGPIGLNQVKKQQSNQAMTSKSLSESIPPTNTQSQSISSQPSPIQQSKVHLGSQSMAASTPQPSQVTNLTSVLQYTAPPSSSLPQSTMTTTLLSTQSQQPLQNPSGQYLPLQPPLQASQQPPLPSLPRPQIPAFPHQGHGQMGPNLGFQHPGGQQMHHHSQTMYHSATVSPAGLGPSFLLGQPPLPKQSLHPAPYQGGGPHLGMEFNQVGSSNQTDRGSNWIPGMPEIKGAHFPGPPLVSNRMVPSSQPPPSALTPEMEKALLQQVMSLTPEQIIMLPAEQRNQILQLQQLLRQ